MSKKPKYEIIYEFYKEQILAKIIASEEKLPTEMEIAKKFKVSRITVIRALNDLEQDGFIKKIQGSGSYAKNYGESLVTASSSPDIISLVLPYDENFKQNFLKGIEDVAKTQNYFVTFHQTTANLDSEKKVILDLIKRGSKGIILYPSDSPINMELYSSLLIQKFPLVLIDRKISGLDFPIIWTDNHSGYYEITNHLLELGHSKIIFVGTSVYSISSELERYEGFCKAHIDHKVPLLDKHLYFQEDIANIPSDYKPDLDIEHRAINYLFDLLLDIPQSKRPTAIAAVNDSIAELVIKIGLERGISIPRDFSVIGFDDRVFAAHLPIPLTTVSQPTYEIGHQAALILFNLIKNPDSKMCEKKIKGRLLIRKSSNHLNRN
ncbi:HTH-type transcriptional repressor PurR [Candidatus Lokiarchaeum ossiferum]|uniref:HTH-type transcriptional repressor PurR n=1 Tax=Candidatus Lokiarchaeum ossiferum TaxID=2951803 RepID=A0ABY6HLZ0_9ARCH|nr:HTH-type transcriptional repressor PurR [Candidatus Lokiarchaeum sp. B-35]